MVYVKRHVITIVALVLSIIICAHVPKIGHAAGFILFVGSICLSLLLLISGHLIESRNELVVKAIMDTKFPSQSTSSVNVAIWVLSAIFVSTRGGLFYILATMLVITAIIGFGFSNACREFKEKELKSHENQNQPAI